MEDTIKTTKQKDCKRRRDFNVAQFTKYAKENYDLTVDEIDGKYKHCIKTAEIGLKLARMTNGYDELAFTIGLLHDYARLEQYAQYNTFNDYDSIDHGDLACYFLFKKGEIKKFDIDYKNDSSVIDFAIRFHNKYEINRDAIDEFVAHHDCKYSANEIEYYCKNIRDADKIHIIERLITENRSLSHTQDGITPEIYNSIMNFEPPLVKDVKTKLDEVCISIGYLFNIYFKESFGFINLEKYFKVLEKHYGSFLIEEDKEKLKTIINYVRTNMPSFIEHKYSQNKDSFTING